MAVLDASEAKVHLRLTIQRLGQLQEKKYSQGQITRSDIATLLRQNNVLLARAKAQNLLQEEIFKDLLEILQFRVYLILDHFDEIGQSAGLSPPVAEAASSIIFAAPHTGSRELRVVQDILVEKLGHDFYRAAMSNHDGCVSAQIIEALSSPPPSAISIDDYLAGIAAAYSVHWKPEPQRQDELNVLSEILDPEPPSVVDMVRLRKLCCQGIPDEPPWLRPRIWRLFFGVLPAAKASWSHEIQNQRDSYHDLVRRLLEPFSTLPPPTSPLSPLDIALLNAFKQLSGIRPNLFSALEEAPESFIMSPLDTSSPDDIRIFCATNLDARLQYIQAHGVKPSTSGRGNSVNTPEIRVELDHDETPQSSPLNHSVSPAGPGAPAAVLPSMTQGSLNAHPKHLSALLRLLYLHSCINPANLSPHIPSLVVPLYSVVLQEIEQQDQAHAEADTFWLFEAMIGEFSELEDEDGGGLWMKKFSERLSWADEELSVNLHAKGLDPALPHYSYQWLAPLLTQTLPLSSVIPLWDAMFSRPKRDRECNPKLDYLLDFCTSMLIRARSALFRLGKPGKVSHGLWDDDMNGAPLSSPLRSWELGDAFVQGISLLQHYPVEAAGGIDRLLQMASELHQRREQEAKAQKEESRSLGQRLKVTMWKGFTNQGSPLGQSLEDDDSSDEDIVDDGNETETQQEAARLAGITSRIATTVWRGITNQTVMQPLPSPLTPRSLSPSPSPSIASPEESHSQTGPALHGTSSLWSYAEKLKDSDAVASLAKASTNWRAKAMLGTWGINVGDTSSKQSPGHVQAPLSESSSLHAQGSPLSSLTSRGSEKDRANSLPDVTLPDLYSPPPRPQFFRSPRDSWMQHQPIGSDVTSSTSSQMSPKSDSGLLSKTQNIRESLASLTRSASPNAAATKSGPRPLLLNSQSLITAPVSTNQRSASPGSDYGQSVRVSRSAGQYSHRGSQSSISSLSPSEAFSRSQRSGSRSDWESDSGPPSRIVPLNRRSVSPMAAGWRVLGRPTSAASSSGTSDRGMLSPPPTTRHLPNTSMSLGSAPRISHISVSSEGDIPAPIESMPLEPPARKLVRKKTPFYGQHETDDTSDSSYVNLSSKSPRSRAKRPPPNLSIRVRENSRSRTVTEQRGLSPNSLAPEWPEEHEISTTPKTAIFDGSSSSTSPRGEMRPAGDGNEGKLRKGYTLVDPPVRTRKVSGEGKEAARRTRESAAIEGDDEGYDDLLSAYESEDGVKVPMPQ